MRFSTIRNVALVGALGLAAVWGGCNAGVSYFSSDTVRTKITDAEMQKVDGRYMISTSDGPMVNKDAWYRGKWNSGDVQNEAAGLEGEVVDITKYGWRWHFPTMYENVLDIEPVVEKSEHTR